MKKRDRMTTKKSCVGDFTFYNEWDILQCVERIASNVISKLFNSILEYNLFHYQY
jgi:hypothetical protein